MARAANKDTLWRCAGCGTVSDRHGWTDCECPTGILWRPSDHGQMSKPLVISREIDRLRGARSDVIAKLRRQPAVPQPKETLQ